MTNEALDLFVIGAGSGGVRAARASARHGARVAIAEQADLGGTCVHLGCIPKKLFVYAAHVSEELRDAAGYGWRIGEHHFDWKTLLANKDQELARLGGIYQRLLEQAGVQIARGRARLVGPHEVEVEGQRYRAERILVATGGWPFTPAIPGAELAISSNEAFHLPELPRRVLIVGGGYIAVEFAGIFDGLGAEVVQLHRGPLFLRGFDHDVAQALADEMRRKGIDLRMNAALHALSRAAGGGITAQLADGSALETDAVLFATGRRPRTHDLGLEALGVALAERGAIAVDEYSQTSVPSIYAIGDVTDRIALTPVAIHEAEALARSLFAGKPTPVDHRCVASAVFSQPPLAAVGLPEDLARAEYGAVDIYRSQFRPLRNTLSGNPERALVKLIVDRASDRVLGVHVLGPDAGEIVQGFAVALKMGATKAQLDATVGIHPTLAEELVTLRTPVG